MTGKRPLTGPERAKRYRERKKKAREAQKALRKLDAGGVFFSGEALYAGQDVGTVEAALANGTGTAQAILAAKAGATFVSPFIGRLDDIGENGMQLIADIVQIYKNYDALKTEVLVASVRHPIHIIDAAKMGAHVATLPPAVLRSLFNHPLTEKGLAAFLADWAKTGQSIL